MKSGRDSVFSSMAEIPLFIISEQFLLEEARFQKMV